MSNVIALDTRATVKAPRKPRGANATAKLQRIADLNNTIVECGFNVARAEAFTAGTVEALVKLHAAGQFDFTTTRRRFHAGYLAYRLKKATAADKVTPSIIEAMLAILEQPGAKSDKPNRRTVEQERAYGASRTAWSSIMKKAGIETKENRGKGSVGRAGKAGKAAKAKAAKAAKAAAEAAAKVASTAELPPAGIANAYELALHVRKTVTDLLHCAKKRAKLAGSADLQRILTTALAELAKIDLKELDGAPAAA